MADSVQGLHLAHGQMFEDMEWFFTLLFTAEYIARLLCVGRPLRYALSFFGIIDLVAVLPTYLAFFFPELYVLIDVRALRLLRCSGSSSSARMPVNRLWRHRAQDRSGAAADFFLHDAAGLGHSGGAHRHCDGGNGGAISHTIPGVRRQRRAREILKIRRWR